MIKKIIALFAVTLMLAACGDSENAEKSAPVKKDTNAKHGDALIQSMLGDASGLIYNITSDSASHDSAAYMYNGLVRYDKNLKIEGELAESWTISEDKKTIRFKLRKNVKWHDGVPFTAKDVEFTYKTMIDDKTPTVYDGDFRKVEKFEVIDDYTIEVTYPEPYAPALISWGMAVLPKHLLEGKDIAKSPLIRKPVGTGPYKFKEWKPGESITVVANDDYFEGRPNIDRIVYRIIPDTATTFLELLNGSIDIMGLTPLQWTKQSDSNPRFKNQYNKYKYLGNSYVYIGYNQVNPLFKDKRVRQALSYASPKQKIIDSILFGLGIPADGPLKPGTIWHNPNVKKYTYDLEKAKQLLEEAGWTDKDGDGIREKNGKKLEFSLMSNQGNTVRANIAEIVQKSWQEIGVKADIRILEWATFINEYIDKRKFEAVVLGWSLPQDPDLYDVWHSSSCKGKKLNFICYQNEEVDRLIVEALKEYDPEKRKLFYHKIQEIMAEEQPYTFLYVPYNLVALSNRFENIEPAPAGLTHNLLKWYVKKENRKYNFTR